MVVCFPNKYEGYIYNNEPGGNHQEKDKVKDKKTKSTTKRQSQRQKHNDNDKKTKSMTRLNLSHDKEHVWMFALQSIN